MKTKRTKLPLVVQVEALRREFPHATVRANHKGLEWLGQLQPSAISDLYTVRVVYKADGRRPVVTVVSPDLIPDTNGKLPHIFPGGNLCLHSAEDWHPGLFITRSVLPWIAEWLLHYEFWRATDDWHGGGHEPTLYALKPEASSRQRVAK